MAAGVKTVISGVQIPVTEKYYREVIENASSYNARLCSERKLRLPFLDSQTGVAQNHSNLYIPYRYRAKPTVKGQLYTYPAKRWKKKKRTSPLGGDFSLTKANEVESGETDMHQINAVENPAAPETPVVPEPVASTATWPQEYYDEWDNLSEPPDAGEIDDRHSDSSDYEQTYIKKKKKKPAKKGEKKSGGGRGRRSTRGQDMTEVDEVEKPYGCDLCGARYKTRPGLTYHLTHVHKKAEEAEEAPSPAEVLGDNPATDEGTSSLRREKEKNKEVSKYCDFCLGDESENKKTGSKEELVSCADCGRSGHPGCLQFTPNMIISVKKYPWQCIECKSCGLCGTSDNDDQLLFCDDCDRGYHMYCLNPPLSEPPEGSWSCHLCIIEFYNGKKPDNGQP